MKQKKIDFLEAVQKEESPTYSALGEEIGVGKSSVSKYYVKPLEKKGLIEVYRESNPHIVEITKEGLEKLVENQGSTGSPQRVNKEGKQSNYFVHNFQVAFPVKNSEFLDESWRERLFEYHDMEYKEFEEFDHVVSEVNKWRFRLTDDTILVRSKEEVRGDSVQAVKEQILELCHEGMEFLVDSDLPVVVDESPASFRVVSQHIGSIGENLGQAFVKYIDERTDSNPSHFRVNDDEDELRIWCDKSSGELQFESGNGGNPSGRRDTAESDQAFFEEVSSFMVQNKSQTRDILYRGPEKINSVEEVAQEARNEVSKQGEELRDVRQYVSELQQQRKSEKGTRDALIELVRSNKQERQEMEKRFQEQLENQQEIIERQEEMIEKQSEIIESLQEEVQDLRDDKSLEERVRERFDSNPNFSQVHEHSSSENQSLYVWDLSEGWENRKYRKVLDEELRDLRPGERVDVSADSGGVQAYG